MVTHFEGYSHEQLWAMVSAINPEAVKSRATSLTTAATTIAEIGEALKNHKVTGWEGDAALAFQNWVSRAGSATLRLSDYSKVGGQYMTLAAQVMIEAKRDAEYDAGATAKLQANLDAAKEFHNDPDALKIGQQSYSTLTGNHQRAIDALTKLAQRYEESAKEMGSAEVPTFPPPPGDFVPQVDQYSSDYAQRGGGGANNGGASYAAASSPGGIANEPGWVPGSDPRRDNVLSPTIGPGATPGPVAPDRNVDVDLDHVATLPETSLPPTTSIPGPGPVSGGSTPGGTPPPLTLPPMIGGGGPGLPGIGPGGLPPGIAPGGKVGGKIGGLAPVLPRDAGIVGGRQVPVSGPSGSIPRGTVIGEGMQGGGRGMMGGGMGGGGLGGSHGVPGGSMAGRRLAMEQGGVVGGRQPGVGGRSTMGGQPFTQGGSGLVRNGSGAGPVGGAMGHGGAGVGSTGRRRDEQGGERPDYLSEDEETWQADRRVVPPVID
ncbi:hypothetical protein OHU17_22030 [Streptomyces goshikiensis]|uniref:PPE family domain-containing protein n=1 Tax=Streptomyces goshikiensis TaxID=1942 RepID=A0ABZ1RNH6_9ACTN|nr:hypothetical protein [Streptomyces goshikiensis]